MTLSTNLDRLWTRGSVETACENLAVPEAIEGTRRGSGPNCQAEMTLIPVWSISTDRKLR